MHLNTKEFGRIAAQTARNIIRQGIRDGGARPDDAGVPEQAPGTGDSLVERIDPRTGAATLRIGKAEAVLPKSEQVGGEELKEGDHVKVYVVDVRETEKGPRAMISAVPTPTWSSACLRQRCRKSTTALWRSKRFPAKRVPHEVGRRQPQLGCRRGWRLHRRARRPRVQHCQRAGRREDRHRGIQRRSGEIYRFRTLPSDGPSVVTAEDGSHACRVTVPDSQLFLAIGNKGQNARLAAKLTGWKIDIKPESGFMAKKSPLNRRQPVRRL